ncbi:hypothetical protein F6V30_10050 [Oryzomonas sagensis]|uniref:Glycosyltransferase RgtA/B/C/D-like domain-containing protein n=1 Tax=Oryzomonas sagensis TaxID=2603857 RepID=A0ABQ6TQ12_9BACT|nr:glycosyltransferase family 39 protein [Oryzomonas sagensis]KAB0670477.1 hypothetical protein F6V30_10050 [Oryzomonas sagensis]
MMNSNSSDRSSNLLIIDIFLFSLAFYLLILSGLNIFDVGQARVDVLSSLTNHFDFNVPTGSGVKGVDGRDYSWFGIGSVLLGIPFYLLGKLLHIEPATLIPLVNVTISASTNCLMYVFTSSIGYSKRISLTISFIYGFTTMACYYAKDPGDQSIETLFILFSVYCMHKHTITQKTSYIIYSAFSIGMAVITRINAVIAIPAVLTLLLLEYIFSEFYQDKLKQIVTCICLFCICLTPFAALNMWYNYYRFGSVFETGYGIMATKWGLNIFAGTNTIIGLTGLLFSPGKGFFFYSPPTLFFFISVYCFFKLNFKIALCFVTLIISYFAFYSKYLFWHGDWAWGPRFLLATIPYFIIPIASILSNPSGKLKTFIVAGVILGAAIQITAISISPYRYFNYLKLNENIKFDIAQGDGVQPIQEPPTETYFNWRRSPILYHVKFVYDSAKKLSNYNYVEKTYLANNNDVLSQPYMNIFDFKWLYLNYINHTYKGILVPLLMIIVLCACGKNIYIHSNS